MDLNIFDRDFNMLGILDNFFSLRWLRRYYSCGEFELHCPLTIDNLKLLQAENIIYKAGDFEAGFIEYMNLRKDDEGKEIIVVKGRMLSAYLERRIILGTQIINNTAEQAMRLLIKNNCIDPGDEKRKIKNLMLGHVNNFTHKVDYQVSYKNILEEIENLSILSNLGFRMIFDIGNKGLIFDIYKGLDRSINQNENPKMIFSSEFENILNQEYIENHRFKNVAIVGGIGEGKKRKIVTAGNVDSSGLDRFEVFADQRMLSNQIENSQEDETMSEEEYKNLLISKGKLKLEDNKKIKTFDATININNPNVKYKIDFDLGDIVTIINKSWGVTLSPRITEIEEVYEENGFSINATLGNNIPTLIDKVKQIVR